MQNQNPTLAVDWETRDPREPSEFTFLKLCDRTELEDENEQKCYDCLRKGCNVSGIFLYSSRDRTIQKEATEDWEHLSQRSLVLSIAFGTNRFFHEIPNIPQAYPICYHIEEEWQCAYGPPRPIREASKIFMREIQSLYPGLYEHRLGGFDFASEEKESTLLTKLHELLGFKEVGSDPKGSLLRAQVSWERHGWTRLMYRLWALFLKVDPKRLSFSQAKDLVDRKGSIWFCFLLWHCIAPLFGIKVQISQNMSYREFQASMDKFESGLRSFEVDYTMELEVENRLNVDGGIGFPLFFTTLCVRAGRFPPDPYAISLYPNTIQVEINEELREMRASTD